MTPDIFDQLTSAFFQAIYKKRLRRATLQHPHLSASGPLREPAAPTRQGCPLNQHSSPPEAGHGAGSSLIGGPSVSAGQLLQPPSPSVDVD